MARRFFLPSSLLSLVKFCKLKTPAGEDCSFDHREKLHSRTPCTPAHPDPYLQCCRRKILPGLDPVKTVQLYQDRNTPRKLLDKSVDTLVKQPMYVFFHCIFCSFAQNFLETMLLLKTALFLFLCCRFFSPFLG